MSKKRVLIIEDDRSLLQILAYNVEQAGYDVNVAEDGPEGLSQAQQLLPDLILLDLLLPTLDGLEVCRRLRASEALGQIRILVLSAKSDESDQATLLASGADDFVTKPFSMKVLLERIKALLRRSHVPLPDDAKVACCGIHVDKLRRHVSLDGRVVMLTPTEFALLDAMIRQPGRAFTRAELIDAAMGGSLVLERTIDVHVMALRKKLSGAKQLIQTVRGIGYRFCDSDIRDAK